MLHANQAPLPVIWRHSRSSAFPRALDAVTECSQSTHPTHRWMRKPGSRFEEHFGQQAPAAQLTGAQAPAGELIGHRSPARSRAAFAPRPSGCWPLTASAPARHHALTAAAAQPLGALTPPTVPAVALTAQQFSKLARTPIMRRAASASTPYGVSFLFTL